MTQTENDDPLRQIFICKAKYTVLLYPPQIHISATTLNIRTLKELNTKGFQNSTFPLKQYLESKMPKAFVLTGHSFQHRHLKIHKILILRMSRSSLYTGIIIYINAEKL